MMLTVAFGAKMLISDMPPPLTIRPKNCSVPSTRRSLIIGTLTVVEVCPVSNIMGTALALVVPMKSRSAIGLKQ